MKLQILYILRRTRFLHFTVLILMCWLISIPTAMCQIIADGKIHEVNSVGKTKSLRLPDNDQITAITFTLTGGDGGYARVNDSSGSTNASFRSEGGEGATISTTFRVGPGSGDIPPGALFRVVEGEKGENGDFTANNGNGISYGGGGGGSAVLVSTSSGWILLAVAGGGGGAYQGMSSRVASGGRNGQGGRWEKSGGLGSGIEGYGGISHIKSGGGGGGHFGSSFGSSCTEGNTLAGGGGMGYYNIGHGGQSNGCPNSTWINGGRGYGGGGAGGGVGGGGGGYSGGGAGKPGTSAGGGGSFFDMNYISSVFHENGSSTLMPKNGKITYQVELKIPPEAICQDATIYLDESGNTILAINDIDNGSKGDKLTKKLNRTDFTCMDAGMAHEVILKVTDNRGSSDYCIAYVTVLDDISPIAICKDITVYLDHEGKATLDANSINNGSSDNCSIIKSIDISEFGCSDIGNPVKVTLTVEDPGGNAAKCEAIVTVLDTISPIAKCKDIIVYLNDQGKATIVPDNIDNGSYDNCSIASKSIDISEFGCEDVGNSVAVTLKIEDPSGNKGQCVATVTVLDTLSPVVRCKDITVYLDDKGKATINVDDIDDGSVDNCSIVSFSIDISEFGCEDVGNPVAVMLTVEDSRGNKGHCKAEVTVLDQTLPVAICKDITVYLDHEGKAIINADSIDNGSSDNCSIIKSIDISEFNCGDIGNPVEVTLTVKDPSGNEDHCVAYITVEDNLRPAVRSKDISVILDRSGKASVTSAMIDDGSRDNCSIVSMWLEGNKDFHCGDEGVHEVVLKARDQSGNVGSSNAFVNVISYVPDFKNKHGIVLGDTIHQINCQIPWDVNSNDILNSVEIRKYGTLRAYKSREKLPKKVSWGMYDLWRYEYIFEDYCGRKFTFSFHLALYDLHPPIYQNFPRDTTVESIEKVPGVDKKVRIIDVCQYVVWDTVYTTPVIDMTTGDTLGLTRRWMAEDPSGHRSFRDQMIWISSGKQNFYGRITGRVVDSEHILTVRHDGEAGTNGIPVSLYRIDEEANKRIWVDSWTTGDWLGTQGTYHFAPHQTGLYQVKLDSSLCLVDTFKFDKNLWSDTLKLMDGQTMDLGWTITRTCAKADEMVQVNKTKNIADLEDKGTSSFMRNAVWSIYPNPSTGYLYINIDVDDDMRYRIYDALGRSVRHGLYRRDHRIDLRGLNAGVYHLQLKGHDANAGMKKIILVK